MTTETEKLARLLREGERLHARRTGAVVPQPWDAMLEGAKARYLAMAGHAIAAGCVLPVVPEPTSAGKAVPSG